MIGYNCDYAALCVGKKELDMAAEEGKTVENGGVKPIDIDSGRRWFVQGVPAVLPDIENELLAARSAAKKLMEAAEKRGDYFMRSVYNAKQLAIKLACNAAFGFAGAHEGFLSCPDVASSITAFGRQMIGKVVEVSHKHGFPVVYGDSVVGDTTLIIRNTQTKQIKTCRIDDLIDAKSGLWKPWGDYNEKDAVDFCDTNIIEVWSDKGFTPIKKLIRHETLKQIKRITTQKGFVDVTEDHSLVLASGEAIASKQVQVSQELLHKSLTGVAELLNEEALKTRTRITSKVKRYTYKLGKASALEIQTKIDEEILHWPLPAVKHFLAGFTKHYDLQHTSRLSKDTLTNLHLLSLRCGKNLEMFGSGENAKIKEITDVRTLENSAIVYDLETSNHHFAVGPGELVVHNTDSVLIQMPELELSIAERTGEDDKDFIIKLNKYREMADKVAVESTALFPKPIKIVREKIFFNLLLSKRKG
jgi:hypothetical protein